MSHLNIEIKACCNHLDIIRKVLKKRNAVFKGVDNQVDTYFKVPNGRLKIREGNIEHSLVYYNREDKSGPKKSVVTLYHPAPDSALKEILTRSLGVLVVVKKKREIYFVDNIKFHIDEVERLGSFVEIEAIDNSGTIGEENLLRQCKEYINLFCIQPEDLISGSYSDMLLSLKQKDLGE